MADTVPTIPIPQTETAPLPKPYSGFSPPPESFGAGVGAGLARLGSGLERVSEQADALAVMEAETVYTKGVSEQLHGRVDTDPNTGESRATPGFADLRGHAALEASSDLSQALAQRRLEIADGLKNDRQRRLFLGRTQGDLISAQRAVEAHVGQQIRYLAEEGFKTRVESALDLATKGAVMRDETGPVGLQIASQQLESMKPWLEVEAERRGLRGDDAKRFVQDGQGLVVKAVVQRLLEEPGRALDAKVFLEAHRDAISEKDAYAFRAPLAAADVRDRSRVQADSIWQEAGQDPQTAMGFARALKDTDLSDAVQRRLSQRISEDHAARTAADSPREGRLDVLIAQGKGLDRNSADYQSLSDEGKARVEFKAVSASRSDTAEQRARDKELFWEFKGLPLKSEDGSDKVSVNIDQSVLFSGASPAMRAELRARQAEARAEWQKDQGYDRKTFLDKLRLVADQLGWRGSEKPGAGTLRANFLDQLGSQYDDYFKANPTAKTVPPDVVRRMISEALRYGDLGGVLGSGFGSTNRYFWQIPVEQRGGFVPRAGGERAAKVLEEVMPPPAATPAPAPPRPGPVAPAALGVGPAIVNSDADYEALASGTEFVGPDGKKRRKP